MVSGSNPDAPASGTKLSTESLQELRACTGSVFRSVDFHIAECVAVVARRPHKPKVVGSNPTSRVRWHGAMVAHLTCNEVVVGSTPSASSNFFEIKGKSLIFFLLLIIC